MRKSQHRYDTTLDRSGIALATGGMIGGSVATALIVAGGAVSPLNVIFAFVVGTILSAMTVVVVAGPIWLVCHNRGTRGPITAISVGALAAFALFLGGQTYGFGLFAAPPSDTLTLTYRWWSAAATSLVLALIGALIGLAMWRVAYRREWLAQAGVDFEAGADGVRIIDKLGKGERVEQSEMCQ